MKRRDARIEAFQLIFEMGFKDYSADELVDLAQESRDVSFNSYTTRLVHIVYNHRLQIDEVINNNLTKWKSSRIPKTNLAILRLAVAELMFMPDVPEKVSINEAVELAKIYGTEDDSSFVNAVLGSVVKNNTFIKDEE